ncbi:MAG: DNA-processing protein DprA [Candidatus Freyarchaeota archaeon]
MNSSDIVYWLMLQERYWLIPASKVEQFWNRFHSLEKLWKVDASYLKKLGLDEKTINAFMKYRNSVRPEDYEKVLEVLKKDETRVLRYVDKEYPVALKNLVKTYRGPPLVLFHKGTLLNFNDCVAIVGTRNCSHHGHVIARKLGKEIAKSGYTVISGLARGIDTEAHCGALETPHGKTIAVLAWMDPIYPPENAELAKDIMTRGALLSERYFKPDSKFTQLTPGKFVERNRITSGLSRCVIVVESGKGGGTFHQVRIAMLQGRKVFVFKPKVRNKLAMEGYNRFLEMGATPITSVKPVLDFLKKSEIQTTLKDKIITSTH